MKLGREDRAGPYSALNLIAYCMPAIRPAALPLRRARNRVTPNMAAKLRRSSRSCRAWRGELGARRSG